MYNLDSDVINCAIILLKKKKRKKNIRSLCQIPGTKLTLYLPMKQKKLYRKNYYTSRIILLEIYTLRYPEITF